MKSFDIQEFGIGNLKPVEKERPAPGSFEVLVRMTAASLNYRDYMVVKGVYNPKLKRPMTALSDGSGVVEEIGPGVTRFKKGDRVAACFMQTWIEGPLTREKGASALGGGIDGVLREFAVFAEQGLVRTPDFLSDEEMATLPCAAVTAWHALFETCRNRSGRHGFDPGNGRRFRFRASARARCRSADDCDLEQRSKTRARQSIRRERDGELPK